MKKLIAITLVLTMCIVMTACGNGNKKAFEVSKVAYENVNTAYKITEQFGTDVYEAWRLGIYEEDEILDDGVSHLALSLSLSEDELNNGVGYIMADVTDKDWFTLSYSEKSELIKEGENIFEMMDNDLFSLCVVIVTSSYIVNGKIEEAQNALDTAKSQMKELSESYSDYEHYPNLKGFYTTTGSFFDFCQEPTGSFQQLKYTINDYKNEARDYINDLDYIFEE